MSSSATRKSGNMDLHSLYEQLIHLDEIAGQLDPETNARIERQRVALKQQIREIEEDIGVDKNIVRGYN